MQRTKQTRFKRPSLRFPFKLSSLTNPSTTAKIDKIADVFARLPHLPKKVISVFVFVMPWLTLIGAIMSIVVGPVAVILSLISLLTLDLYIIVKLLITTFILLANAYLLAKAFMPLRRKEMLGWVYLFWSYIVGLFSMFSDVLYGEQAIIGMVISTILGGYLIFELRAGYVKKMRRRDVYGGGSNRVGDIDVINKASGVSNVSGINRPAGGKRVESGVKVNTFG